MKVYDYFAEIDFYGVKKEFRTQSMSEMEKLLGVSHMTLRRIIYKDGSKLFPNIRIVRTPIAKSLAKEQQRIVI